MAKSLGRQNAKRKVQNCSSKFKIGSDRDKPCPYGEWYIGTALGLSEIPQIPLTLVLSPKGERKPHFSLPGRENGKLMVQSRHIFES
jgi:hypothetical protein